MVKKLVTTVVATTVMAVAGGNTAQATATNSVDFGRLVAGETEVGIGYGYSSLGEASAVAGGVKYAATDDVSIVGKAATDVSENVLGDYEYSLGAGLVYKF